MKPRLLGVYVPYLSDHENNNDRTSKIAELLQGEYSAYEICVLLLDPNGSFDEMQKDIYEQCRIAMRRSDFEILVVNGAHVSQEVYDLFSTVPPDVEVVNATLWSSDLDREVQSRFRAINLTAIRLMREWAQAYA